MKPCLRKEQNQTVKNVKMEGCGLGVKVIGRALGKHVPDTEVHLRRDGDNDVEDREKEKQTMKN